MNTSENKNKGAQYHGKLIAKLLFFGVGMFAFAMFLMPPLYDVFCEITGLNGKTGGRYTASLSDMTVENHNRDRSIKVQFIANNNETMPWEFRPNESSVTVEPTQVKQVSYFALNPTQIDMVGQAVPSVVPFEAAQYFHKTECFCFQNQPLSAGEQADLVLQFIIDPDIPDHIHTITLAYTIFDITQYSMNETSGSGVARATH